MEKYRPSPRPSTQFPESMCLVLLTVMIGSLILPACSKSDERQVVALEDDLSTGHVISALPNDLAKEEWGATLAVVSEQGGSELSAELSNMVASEPSPIEFSARFDVEEMKGIDELITGIESERSEINAAFSGGTREELDAALGEWRADTRAQRRAISRLEHAAFLQRTFPHRYTSTEGQN